MPLLPIALLLISYLIGSIPFSWLVARAFSDQDLRDVGSGNVGATNVMRNAGKRAGIVALLLDLSKGVVAVVLARLIVDSKSWPLVFTLGASDPLHAPSLWIGLAALIAVLGHLYPVWLKFRGGKGVATAAGVFLALDPRSLGAALIVFARALIVTKYVSVASMAAAASLPIWIRFLSRPPMWINLAAITIALLVIVKHHSNIARLARGEERKFPR